MFDKYDQVKLLHWKIKVIFGVFILGGIAGGLFYLSYSHLLEPAIAYIVGSVLFRIAPDYFMGLGNWLSIAVDYYQRIQEAQGGFDWGATWVALAAGAFAPAMAAMAVLAGVFRRREAEE
ncbi:hypothetical protein [Thiomonas arsenitoxydans]|uniref:Uncharacterized protein n=1 Tax=Thiomonas arsenitoxydans (strain DSM 22701 / CIP 110005 / 3As) TaxID=426114 RepID=D6CTV7_THIA3|nr:hypothetical protein [Thiomonas arsenitoxydans]CAZ88726.1 hypothetical protein; putative membrane protein [Thiomonas arsenitoxydans]